MREKFVPLTHLSKLMVSALECVDYVTLFTQQEPSAVISTVQPDVLFKGLEYKGKPLPELTVFGHYGGRLEFVPPMPDWSTTNLIKKDMS